MGRGRLDDLQWGQGSVYLPKGKCEKVCVVAQMAPLPGYIHCTSRGYERERATPSILPRRLESILTVQAVSQRRCSADVFLWICFLHPYPAPILSVNRYTVHPLPPHT